MNKVRWTTDGGETWLTGKVSHDQWLNVIVGTEEIAVPVRALHEDPSPASEELEALQAEHFVAIGALTDIGNAVERFISYQQS